MDTALIYLLKSTAILSIFYAVYYILLKRDTFFTINRSFLLTGVIASYILPLIIFTTITAIEQPTIRTSPYSPSPTLVESPITNYSENIVLVSKPITTVSSINKPAAPIKINWLLLCYYAYIVGILILSTRFVLQLESLRKIIIKNPKKTKQNFYYITTDKNITPFSFFRYIVYNPAIHTKEELEIILKHEETHAKQYHSIDILLINIITITQWYNPVAWLYKKQIQQNLEFIADQETINEIDNRKKYQLAMVNIATGNYSPIANNFYQSFIKKRIVMLNSKRTSRQQLWKLVIIIPILSIFMWSFNTKEEIEYISTPEIAPIEKETPISKGDTIRLNKDKQENNKIQKVKKTDDSKSEKEESVVETKNNTIDNEINYRITQKTTKKDLDVFKTLLNQKHNISLKYNDIKYNESSITDISLSAFDNNKPIGSISLKNAVFSGINPIILKINYNEKGRTTAVQFFTEKPEDALSNVNNINSTKDIPNRINKFRIANTATKEEINVLKKKLKKEFNTALTIKNLEYYDGHISKIDISFEDEFGNTGGVTDEDNDSPIPNLTLVRETDKNGDIKNYKFYSGDMEYIFEKYDKKSKAIIDHADLGKEPAYLINDTIYKKSEVIGKSFITDTDIQVLSKGDAIKKHGNVAQDGLVIIRNSILFRNENEIMKKYSAVFGKENLILKVFSVTKEKLPFIGSVVHTKSDANLIKLNDFKFNRLLQQYGFPKMTGNPNKDPIIIIDNIAVTYLELRQKDTTTFAKVKKLTPKQSIKEYGDIAPNGAMIITTN